VSAQLHEGVARSRRIFAEDGRSVTVALDHGLAGMDDLAGLRRPSQVIASVRHAGADCVLTTPGIAQTCASAIGRMGLIVRLDGGAVTYFDQPEPMRQLGSVEDAVRWGADGVALMGLMGTPDEAATLERIARCAASCRQWGMVLLAEMLPGGFGATPTVAEVAVATRVACELGATAVKVPFCGTVEEFSSIVADAYQPVLVLGGGGGADVATRLRGAMDAGAAGVAVGRDVWQSDDPARTTRELVELVHGHPEHTDG